MRGLLTALIAGLISLLAATQASAAPALLSHEKSAPDISSTFGSGSFGRWTVDAHKLPAYRYEIDELTSPIAPQPELSGNVNAWSQIGNDRVVADASNHGYSQLWSWPAVDTVPVDLITPFGRANFDANPGHYEIEIYLTGNLAGKLTLTVAPAGQ